MGAEFPLGSSHPKTLVFSEQEISPPSQNESRTTKEPPLLLTNPHLNSRQGINCLFSGDAAQRDSGGGKQK